MEELESGVFSHSKYFHSKNLEVDSFDFFRDLFGSELCHGEENTAVSQVTVPNSQNNEIHRISFISV